MARTGKVNVVQDQKTKDLVIKQIEQLKQQLKQKLNQYKTNHGEEYPLKLVSEKKQIKEYDFINPAHYVQDDGRQTWEHMVDKWGLETTALWCEMTAFKYKDRMGKKPGENVEREEKKIRWYEDKAEELRKKAQDENFEKRKFW